MKAPYLRISLADSDFTSYYEALAKPIYELLEFKGFPKVDDMMLQQLKEPIARLWNAVENTYCALGGRPITDHYPYFLGELSLEVVDFADIECESAESIYVALFKVTNDQDYAILG